MSLDIFPEESCFLFVVSANKTLLGGGGGESILPQTPLSFSEAE